MLVAAVLRPEQREDGQFEMVRLPPEQYADSVELAVGQTEGPVERLIEDPRQGIDTNQLSGGFHRRGQRNELQQGALDGRTIKARATSMVGAASRRLGQS